MTDVPRGTNENRSATTLMVARLALIGGFGVCVLVLMNFVNQPPLSADSPLIDAPVSGAPSPGPTAQTFLAEQQEATAATETATPEAAPSSTASAPTPTREPTPVNDHAEPTEVPAATPTEVPVATTIPATPETGPSTAGSQDAPETGASSAADAPLPNPQIERLRIPAIGVDAPVEVKSIDSGGVMETPGTPNAVAWYDFTALPADAGNAVFAGHLDYAGVGPAVFWNLGNLVPGDRIDVTQHDGIVISYRITSVYSVSANSDASQIVASDGVPQITIITCDGGFDPVKQEYDQRIIVKGDRIE